MVSEPYRIGERLSIDSCVISGSYRISGSRGGLFEMSIEQQRDDLPLTEDVER